MVAGGNNGQALTSTEIINISNRTIKFGGVLTVARFSFPMIRLVTNSVPRVYALGGSGTNSLSYTATVERWEETTESWVIEGIERIDLRGSQMSM